MTLVASSADSSEPGALELNVGAELSLLLLEWLLLLLLWLLTELDDLIVLRGRLVGTLAAGLQDEMRGGRDCWLAGLRRYCT